jgi:hypothetical protein
LLVECRDMDFFEKFEASMSRDILENLRRSKRKNELNRPGELQARYGYAVARMRPRGGYGKSRLLDTDVCVKPTLY